MSTLNQNIKAGILALTTDGTTFKFASLTNIGQDDPIEYGRLKDMQGSGYIEYQTNNQQPCTADFTLTNVEVSQFKLLELLYEDRLPFDLVFTTSDGSYLSYAVPSIKKQPLQTTIEEGESSFNVVLHILANSIKNNFAKE